MNRMTDKKIIKAIERLGLTENEAKCYLALFKKDILTASDTSKISGVPRQNTYKALEQLQTKGLVVLIPGQVKRYAVTDPSSLKDNYYRKLKNSVDKELEELERKKQEVQETGDLIEKLTYLYNNLQTTGDPTDYIEIYKNTKQIHYKFIELCTKVKREMVGFARFYDWLPKNYADEQYAPQQDALKRGVKFRTLYELPADEEMAPKSLAFFQNASKLGEENRFIDKIPFLMIVFDEQIAYFAIKDQVLGNPSYTTVVADNIELAKGLKMCFEALWLQGRDYLIINNEKHYLSKPESRKR